MNKSEQGLPTYNLQVVRNAYPFKNLHVTKIFNVHVWQSIPTSTPHIQNILEVYNSMKSELLVSIKGVSKEEQNLKIQYEYVDTPIHHYIRRSINQSIQLKMEKLLVMLRQLVYQFLTKKINILDAFTVANIGVKVSNQYRESVNLGQNPKKEIQMPNFKVFINPALCHYVWKLEEIGKLIIETDKQISSIFRSQTDQFIQQASQEQHEQLFTLYRREEEILQNPIIYGGNDDKFPQNFKKNKTVQQSKGLEFSHKRRKIRKYQDKGTGQKKQKQVLETPLQTVKKNQISTNFEEVCSNSHEIQSTRSMRNPPLKAVKTSKDQQDQLQDKITTLIERSKKNLKVFRDKFIHSQ